MCVNNFFATSFMLVFAFTACTTEPSAEEKPAKSRPAITISKETTFITEPLDADGYPDYVAAMNRHCSRGVTPENNAAVLFWKAVGPAEIEPERREKYFEMLGIAPLPEKGDYFRPSHKQVELHKSAKKNTDTEPKGYYIDPLYEQLDDVVRRPWSSEEFPVWAEWLKINERPMALLTEASKRPRRYDPCFLHKGGIVIDVPMQSMQYRDVVRAFAARAMLRTHEGKAAEAWEDLLTCHRLARLVGQGPAMIESLVAITVNRMAEKGDRALIEHAKLPASRTAAMQRELDSLPPLLDFAEVLDVGERICFLSYVLPIVRMTPAKRNERLIELEGLYTKSRLKPILDIMGDTGIDWDMVLRTSNSWYDRLVDAFRKPLRADRRKAIDEIDKDIKVLEKMVADVKSQEKIPPGDLRKVGSERVGQVYAVFFIPALLCSNNIIDQSAMDSDLTRLAFTLARYHADRGSYPAKLAELTPKYIGAIPKDIFNNDADLHYAREGDGYLLYSVGLNGRDDGGKGPGEGTTEENCDDIVVRVPSKDEG
ncbi:MAG: hypothetical protein K8R46_12980 [Pirellulales bacterium]|nr:hypothetical protein [Pirellulales bacterium]